LRPVRGMLLEPMAAVFRDRGRPDYDRLLTTTLVADYAADRPDVLADLLLDADGEQYAVLLPKLRAFPDRAADAMSAELARPAGRGAGPAGRAAGGVVSRRPRPGHSFGGRMAVPPLGPGPASQRAAGGGGAGRRAAVVRQQPGADLRRDRRPGHGRYGLAARR